MARLKKIYKDGSEKISKGYGKYKRITITCMDNNHKKIKIEVLIHRLVAYAFLKKEENDTDVNHIDGNPSNNMVGNLEWISHRGNVIHALETGLTPSSFNKSDIEYISKLLINGKSDSDISKIMIKNGYKCSSDRIFRIRNKDNYSRYTKNYIFPKNKPHKDRDKDLALKIYDMIYNGFSNKEIISMLNLNEIFSKKSTINSYLYKFRHNKIWKSLSN